MAAMTLMQGDSYPIYIDLEQDGLPLTPDMVSELEISIGNDEFPGKTLRKLHSDGGVYFDKNTNRWYIHPGQEETLAMGVGYYDVHARIRYKSTDAEEVVGLKIGRIQVTDSISEAVI